MGSIWGKDGRQRRRWLLVIVPVALPVLALAALWLWVFVLKDIVDPYDYEAGEVPYGQSAQIRIDCGDVRLRWLGLIYREKQMPAGVRQELLDLANREPRVPDTWVGVVPRDAGVWHGYYRKVPAWLEVAPNIAHAALADLATWLEATHGQYGAGAFMEVLASSVLEFDKDGRWHVRPNWRQNIFVKMFLEDMRISPESVGVEQEESASEPKLPPRVYRLMVALSVVQIQARADTTTKRGL